MKHYFYLLFIAVLLSSCSENSDDEPPTSGALLIKEIRMMAIDPDDDDEIITYNYEGNRLIDRRYTDGSLMNEYLYENDRLSRINFYEEDAPNVLRAFTTFAYDGSGQLTQYIVHVYTLFGSESAIRSELTYNADGTEIQSNQYIGNFQTQTIAGVSLSYTFANGNLMREDYDVADFDTDYFYDGQNGIHKNIEFINILNMLDQNYGALEGGQNNLIKKDIRTGSSNVLTESYTYTYNAQGYPETGQFLEAGNVYYNLQFSYVNAQ
ncbi:hypothetical protein [uncultured Kordia sp.]|uniref:hypothetical protein n=1 Tax=uncultured Kordia sp. TaxID=507699 RepID=UPI002638C611|nr:hypothetical protein [uncultured Kordia sp.]